MSTLTPPTSQKFPAHILIAEDSGVQAFMLRHILEEHGYQVSVARNGRIALQMAGELRPDLVVSDVNMPQMNGYELCHHIKNEPNLRGSPVILVTNLSESADVLLGLQSGADSFVIKPYNKSHMLARVEHALGNRHAQPTPEETGSAVDIFFNGKKHQITASRSQILNLLLSTYEATVERNKELSESREQLAIRTSEVVAANQFLDSMIEHIPTPVHIKDAAELRFVRVNRAVEALVGLSREQMIGKTAHELFDKDDADVFLAQDRHVLATGAVEDIPENRLSLPTGAFRLIHTRKVPLYGARSEPTHILGIAEDVTQQKEMEKQIRSLNADLKTRAADLEASNKSLESFTSAATHDLRSPLSVIGGYAGLLEKNYSAAMDERGRHYVSVIRSTIKNMGKLIDDLMAFSRLGAGEINKVGVDMQDLVGQVIREVTAFPPAGARPAIDLGALPPARADAALVRQVWVNLLSNAVKYSRHAAVPQIQISGRVEACETVYSVRDNGAGFDMAQYNNLFEMFQRLHTAEEFEGTGVGLPIVHRVVTRHGGRVWAESTVGQGAVFHFSLPV